MTVDELLVSHLDAAYNLARWLVPSEDVAQDVVQEACVRALTFFGSYRGGDAKAWLLSIVRNTCHDWYRRHRRADGMEDFDEEVHSAVAPPVTPERLAIEADDRARVRTAIEALSPALREVLVLRELEGLSYREIAEVAAVPIGTVMSRLSRARAQLESLLRPSEGVARS